MKITQRYASLRVTFVRSLRITFDFKLCGFVATLGSKTASRCVVLLLIGFIDMDGKIQVYVIYGDLLFITIRSAKFEQNFLFRERFVATYRRLNIEMYCYVIRLSLIKLNAKSFAKLSPDKANGKFLSARKHRRKFFSSNLSRSTIVVTSFN